MSRLTEITKKIKWEFIPEETKKIVKEIIANIKSLYAKEENPGSQSDTREVSPKPKIRRPGGEIDKIEDQATKEAIIQLWDFQNELLDAREALL